MRKLIGLGLIAMVSLPVQADIYEQIKSCGSKESESAMLICFKGLPIAKVSEWNVYAPKESLTAIGVQSTIDIEYQSGEKRSHI